MLTRMTRMARMLTHMLTRMTRWLAGSHIIHTHYCFPAIKVTFTTEKNSYLFELIMTEILKKWGKIMMIKIFSTLITCTAELVKGPEG